MQGRLLRSKVQGRGWKSMVQGGEWAEDREVWCRNESGESGCSREEGGEVRCGMK